MKIYVKTFGCQSNYADSEVIKGILNKKFILVNDIKKADIVIVNSCGVKLVTQQRVISFIEKIPKNKRIYVGGCLPRMIDLKKILPKINGLFDVNSLSKIEELIFEGKEKNFSDEKENKINKPTIRCSKETGIINIGQGCLGNCAYCSVKFARGRLKSYSINEIVKAIKKAIQEGCKKIYLSSQDNGCYGYDINTNLPELLREVVKIEGKFKVRVGMMNPMYVLDFLDELIEVYKNDKIMKFLHIPVESGSNKVLKEMKRNYVVEDFIKIIKKFRKNIPKINISTDIIVGYPTETEDDFNKTLSLIKKVKPEVLNVSKFGPRPRTEAAKLKQLDSKIIKERSLKINKIKNSI